MSKDTAGTEEVPDVQAVAPANADKPAEAVTTADSDASASSTPSSQGQARPPKARRLRLYEVERAVSPLRRMCSYASRKPEDVRYMEATGLRWVEKLLTHPLPDSVALDAVELGRQLSGIDAVKDDERITRIGELNALIARIDAMLGLPLDRLKFRRTSKRIYPRKQVELPVPDTGPNAPEAAPSAESDATVAEADKPKSPSRKRDHSYRVPRQNRESRADEPSLPSGPWWLGEGIGAVSLAQRGVPTAWATALAKAGVSTATDLFRLKPSGYETVRPVHGAGMDVPAGRVALGGRIRQRFTAISPSGSRQTRAVIKGAGTTQLVWDEEVPPGLLEPLTPGTRVVAIGQNTPSEGAPQVLTGVELTAGLTQKLAELANYGLEGVSDRIVRGAFRMVRSDLDDLRDPLPDAVCKKHRLVSASDAYEAIHGASTERRAGWKRLAFEEGVYAQLGLALGGNTKKSTVRGIAHPILHSLATRLTTWRDVQVDDDHLNAFEVIKRDLRSSRPMLRVLAGRPGDDRDRVALLTAVTVAESKAQVLWLMPEPVMAEALYTLFEPMLRELGLVSRLLDDAPSRPVRDALRRGEVHIVFGTLELAKAELQMRRLGLVIAQESVPGQTERGALVSEGTASPDVLIVPTRAIGAGHLLGPYAEHAISWVKPARWPRFHTMLVPASKRDAAYQEVLQSIQDGAQALIALPMGKSGDLLEPEEAVRVRTTLETHLPGARIQLFHGALSREERNRRYEDFQRRRFEVLLATHAVEFGADTPGATELIVEQADRMPRERLSRLMHRLVHIDKPTVRLIHGDDPDQRGMEVLHKLKRGRIDDALTPEPFETSEPRLRWLEPSRDVDLLLSARTVALDTLGKDPTLQRGHVADIARALALWWPGLFDGSCPVTVGKSEGGSSRRRRRRRRRR